MTKENSGIDDNLNFTRDLALLVRLYFTSDTVHLLNKRMTLYFLTEFVKYIGELYFSLEDFLA